MKSAILGAAVLTVALTFPAVILRDDVIFADLHFRNGSLLAGHVPATREA
jgi:hypothetical protein